MSGEKSGQGDRQQAYSGFLRQLELREGRRVRDVQLAKDCLQGIPEAREYLQHELSESLSYCLEIEKRRLREESVDIEPIINRIDRLTAPAPDSSTQKKSDKKPRSILASYLSKQEELPDSHIPLVGYIIEVARELLLVDCCIAGKDFAIRLFQKKYWPFIVYNVREHLGSIPPGLGFGIDDVSSCILNCLLVGKSGEHGTLYSYVCGSEGRKLSSYDPMKANLTTFVKNVVGWCCRDVARHIRSESRKYVEGRIEMDALEAEGREQGLLETFEIPTQGLSEEEKNWLSLVLNETLEKAELLDVERSLVELRGWGYHFDEILRQLRADYPRERLPETASGLRDRWSKIKAKLIKYWENQGYLPTIKRILRGE